MKTTFLIVNVLLLLVIVENKTCGDNKFVQTIEDNLISKIDNADVKTAWDTYKASSAVTTVKADLAHCQAFKDETNVCCGQQLIADFKVILKQYFGKHADNKEKKPVCPLVLKQLGNIIKRCGPKDAKKPPKGDFSKDDQEGKRIAHQGRQQQGQAIKQTLQFLRGNLCILCVDPDSANAAQYFDNDKFILAQADVDAYIAAKAAAVAQLDAIDGECQDKVEAILAANADATKCAKQIENIKAFLARQTNCKGDQCKTQVTDGAGAFSDKTDEGDQVDEEADFESPPPATRLLTAVGSDIESSETGMPTNVQSDDDNSLTVQGESINPDKPPASVPASAEKIQIVTMVVVAILSVLLF